MRKTFIALGVAVVAALAVAVAMLFRANRALEQEKVEMQELAELDKQEMENEYERFTLQYSEMMTQINNDSIIEQLTQEQLRTQQLLEELKRVKASDAREIARLKKELATVRNVLRSFIRQVDSLNQVNQALVAENTEVKDQLAQSRSANAGLQQERQTLKEQVAIAAQLDARNITLTAINSRGKATTKTKKCRKLQVGFTVTRNVTATNGNRTFYVRIQTPTGRALSAGSFAYENRQIEYAAKKVAEYTGEELTLEAYWEGDDTLIAGDYRVSIFAEGNMIGTATFTLG